MNLNADQRIVDIKDLLFVMLKKSGVILLVGILFACALGGYKWNSSRKTTAADVAGILNVSEKLPGESDIKYSERQLNVNHANDLVNSIKALNRQIENNREYVSDSVFMQIDSEKEAFTCVNLIISSNKDQANGVDVALASTYRQYIMSGEYLNPIAEEMGVNQGYLAELLSVNIDASNVSINTVENSGSMRVVSVKVIGPSIEFTDKIMDSILESVDSLCTEMNKSIVSHKVTVTERQSAFIVDSSTRDKQTSITYRFESLQQQIINYDKSLDTVAANLGVSKSGIYSYFAYESELMPASSGTSIKSILKYAIVGFAGGVVIVLFCITLTYIFGKKFSTQGKFFHLFYKLNKIGVIKPEKKRSKFASFIDRKTGDDNFMSVDNSNKLLSANVKNLTSDMKSVLFTGTAETSRIEKLVKDLGIKADVKASIFDDPICLETISEYDGIIIVEQRNYSDCSLIAEELKLIDNASTKLIGAIVI